MTEETKTLNAGGGFPVAVAKSTIPNLVDLAAQRSNTGQNDEWYGFALNRENTVKALRRLADELEANRILPQEMSDSTRATVDDFVIRTLTFTFAVRHTGEE